ncbi:hypothetical protein Shyhy01_28600 [Streptomyces hygroscopicus subsp. hygroscopicus]|nr:hypothetical protein Shyhy01_28600 [Streptomyces hygroscopicus subsp. hygroscopicus]
MVRAAVRNPGRGAGSRPSAGACGVAGGFGSADGRTRPRADGERPVAWFPRPWANRRVPSHGPARAYTPSSAATRPARIAVTSAEWSDSVMSA